MKKKKGCLVTVLIVIGLFSFGLIFGITQIIKNPEKYTTSSNTVSKVDMIIDVTQFSRITEDELIKIMGKPSDIEKWNYKISETRQYPTITYTYNKNKMTYEFIIIEGKVVRFTINSEDAKIPFKNNQEVFPMFGITPSDNLKKIVDTGYAFRYHLVSDKIAEVLVLDIDKENKSFGIIKFTYNLNYF